MADKKECSVLQETRVSKYLGWHKVSGSGSRAFNPGDIRSDQFMGECKTHVKPGTKLTFNCNVWKKICDEATAYSRFPVLIVDDGSQDVNNTWCMISKVSCPSYGIIRPFPRNVSKHITFNHEDLIRQYKYIFKSEELGLFEANLMNKPVLLCPLYKFKQFGSCE